MAKIETQHQWVEKIEALSPVVVNLNLKRKTDYAYVEHTNGKHLFNDVDAYNFSNSDLHDEMLTRAIFHLHKKTGTKLLKDLLGELTFRKTYGAFSEIAAYDWLARHEIEFEPQVPLSGADVVNPNGSSVDGRLKLGTVTAYFDIKGFGFYEHKVRILKKKLETEFQTEQLTVEGGIFGSIDSIQDLLEKAGFDSLVSDLKRSKSAVRGALQFHLRPKRRVSISIIEPDPTRSAENNRDYVINFGEQYTRNDPFLLFFVIHPWFSNGSLHQNFSNYTDNFCKTLARLTFKSFGDDKTILYGIEKCELAKLLSGVAFINVWPEKSSMGKGASSRVFLNTAAQNPLGPKDFSMLQQRMGGDLIVQEV
jgi:hypothetical protein